jgi:hypothetical protein
VKLPAPRATTLLVLLNDLRLRAHVRPRRERAFRAPATAQNLDATRYSVLFAANRTSYELHAPAVVKVAEQDRCRPLDPCDLVTELARNHLRSQLDVALLTCL